MQISELALGKLVWSAPLFAPTPLGRLAEGVYCRWHADKFRLFFLGMVAADQNIAPEEKVEYCTWLQGLPWYKLARAVFDTAPWQKSAEKAADPIYAAIRIEYHLIFRRFQRGDQPEKAVI